MEGEGLGYVARVEDERDERVEEVRLRDCEERVRGLTKLAAGGAEINEEVLQIILELVQLDVVPTAIAQVLKSLSNKAKQNKAVASA